ncbi:MAG: ATP-binding cassette domain-containing protein [Acidimicrobiia bacterium]|nr:ATP-binding cassette domain-containing protein [Acidimicrobiia bacterium]
MAANVVETTGLTKHFGDVRAVQDLSLQVPRGTVFGLLGPNGAGKTTIIGTLLGLIRPTAGAIRLFGVQINGSTDEAVRRIGAIMETPAFYPYLSGRDNLRYFQGIGGRDDAGEIDRLLGLVGLSDRAENRFNTYSLGMKHRLGLAYALLGDPELLLLDEPTNGLDPSGMAEVRQLLRELGDGERTVVLASHLLNEVEQVCDRVAILSEGRVIAEGEVSALIGRRDRLRLSTTDDGAARRVLGELEWVGSVLDVDGALLVEAAPERAGELSEALARVGVYPTELRGITTSLEQYFLEVTGEGEDA